MALNEETRKQYITIIDSILAVSDLNTISAKRIRAGLQQAVDHDISPQKSEITSLIMERFDKFTSDSPPQPTNGNGTTNGTSTPVVNGSNKRASPHDYSSPPIKKHKASRSIEDSDAAFAARLQAEGDGRARSTRGGGTRRKTAGGGTPKKDRVKKKKSKTKVGSEDDSNTEGGAEVKNTGFHKPLTLSAPLAALLGETSLSRPQTVKKIWEYIRENNLQDPTDKRQVICDSAMRSVFKQDKVHMFTMNKILSQNLYAQEELVTPTS